MLIITKGELMCSIRGRSEKKAWQSKPPIDSAKSVGESTFGSRYLR
jgi:hypothetical protein